MRAVDIILKKREGLELSKEEIDFIIDGFVKDTIPAYQVSALLMAICFNGTTEKERFFLTKAMLESGEQVGLSKINGICVDKHSTGGVGDKTSLVVGPLAASFGLKLAKMSGRGLGHTGGTLDKLESIPDFSISLSTDEIFKQVNDIGLCLVGQTANITPADKELYALRDVTGTVESVGLISSSIMSKKLASGAHYIFLDVKVGDGAFMKDLDSARTLAKAMVKIGDDFGRKTIAMLTDMDQPLGEAVGNSLEVIEAIETLKGRGPVDFTHLCYESVAEMLVVSKIASNKDEAFKMIEEKMKTTEPLEKLRLMIERQHGNPNVIDDYSLFGKANEVIEVRSEKQGYVKHINTTDIGVAAMLLGAGRNTMEDKIDPVVGIKALAKKGDIINKGDLLGLIYTNGKNTNEAIKMFKDSYQIVSEYVPKDSIILDIIGE